MRLAEVLAYLTAIIVMLNGAAIAIGGTRMAGRLNRWLWCIFFQNARQLLGWLWRISFRSARRLLSWILERVAAGISWLASRVRP